MTLITTAIGQIAERDDGWVSLGLVGKRLLELRSDFDPRSFGHARLSDLARKTGVFDVETRDGGGMLIRLKPQASKAS